MTKQANGANGLSKDCYPSMQQAAGGMGCYSVLAVLFFLVAAAALVLVVVAH